MPTYPTASDTFVGRLNVDTLPSNAWLDLTKEPVIVAVPDTNGRYHLLPMLETWTDRGVAFPQGAAASMEPARLVTTRADGGVSGSRLRALLAAGTAKSALRRARTTQQIGGPRQVPPKNWCGCNSPSDPHGRSSRSSVTPTKAAILEAPIGA